MAKKSLMRDLCLMMLKLLFLAFCFGQAASYNILRVADSLDVSSVINRRNALRSLGIGGAFTGATLTSVHPAVALRSVLNEASQASFDKKESKRTAPPPPPKSLQEIMGVEGKPGQKEPEFARPKFERVADKKKREEAEAAYRASLQQT